MKPNPSLEAYVKPREPDKEQPHVVYLAAPFTSDDPEIQRARKQATMALSDRMVRQGSVVFSPLEYTQSMQARGVFPPQGWYDFDIAIMKGCHEGTGPSPPRLGQEPRGHHRDGHRPGPGHPGQRHLNGGSPDHPRPAEDPGAQSLA